ncbi:uncharacterized protein LOC115919123 [Strongylocentrotus purpuratus]|uniref:Nanos-type domain-containing protein n=1 Tax=Strongylocentrotus purpuratus TaxID=7668 RepID=A0A7M7MWU6_STRPU|nr:uncharacterized protein LOC115919123 [Strongylocentrotus purpuratus]|eukprot:XP_001177221.1 PREDICTED: uncharacterized protein LOC754101 [Strongylocentrotus purpuratus]
MYDPFNDYLGLSGLLSNCRVNDEFISTPFHHNDDFESNGVNVPMMSRSVSSISDLIKNNMVSGLHVSTSQTSTASTGFMPLQLPLNIAKITELSKVMRGGIRRAEPNWCVFCKNNGESEMVYVSHKLKSKEGITTCPILRAYTCPLCGTNGNRAHTVKYCPKYKEKQIGSTSGPVTIGSQYRTPRTSTGRRPLRSSSLSLSSDPYGSLSSYIGGNMVPGNIA